uniref:Uncharacterized protein n=1 Tax=Babesia bovis TaxID=5865 RepID=S6B883_BABBO|nr:hypothetical protein [Babesia bovis]
MGHDRNASRFNQSDTGGTGTNNSKQDTLKECNRQMIPFFTDEDKRTLQDIELSDNRKGNKWNRPVRSKSKSKSAPFPQFHGKEIGLNSTPIGHFPIIKSNIPPVGLNVTHRKRDVVHKRSSSDVMDLFDKFDRSERYDLDDETNSDRQGSNYTMSTTFETSNNVECSETASEMQDLESYCGNVLRTQAPLTPWLKHEELTRSMPFARESQQVNRYSYASSYHSEPNVITNTEGAENVANRPKPAYAFSKYVCSPDPSSYLCHDT